MQMSGVSEVELKDVLVNASELASDVADSLMMSADSLNDVFRSTLNFTEVQQTVRHLSINHTQSLVCFGGTV